MSRIDYRYILEGKGRLRKIDFMRKIIYRVESESNFTSLLKSKVSNQLQKHTSVFNTYDHNTFLEQTLKTKLIIWQSKANCLTRQI